MHGIPMVATSPVRHDSPVGPGMIGSSDIQSYEPPWKALSDFALHTDLDRLNPNTPHFQHLVNQVRFYFEIVISIILTLLIHSNTKKIVFTLEFKISFRNL